LLPVCIIKTSAHNSNGKQVINESLFCKDITVKSKNSVEPYYFCPFLLGRYPQPVTRNKVSFLNEEPKQVYAGIPSQLLNYHPDIKLAELALAAARLDVKVARTTFYPILELSAGAGFQAFNPSYLVKFPKSLLFNMAGDLAGP
jgi:hypothetical protein